MSVYKGNQKQGTIYKGSTKIGKVYKGTSLVYQSGYPIIQGLCRVTSSGTTYDLYDYLIGGLYTTAFESSLHYVPITSITGSLGASGSKVVMGGESPYNKTATFSQKSTIGNKNYYIYKYTISGSGWSNGEYNYILTDKSRAGGYAIQAGRIIMYTSIVTHPVSVSANSFVAKSLDGSTNQTYNVTRRITWDGNSDMSDYQWTL